MGNDSIYHHYLEYQDGPGMQYRRKSLFQIGHIANLVVYRPPEAPFRLAWVWGLLAANAVALAAIAMVFLRGGSRRRPAAAPA
jgi:hypothetical protein